MSYSNFFTGLLLIVAIGCKSSHNTAPTGLMTDLLLHPEEAVITSRSPNFSWIAGESGSNIMQSAFRITVASGPELLEQSDPDIWDSGKINSDQSIAVPYNGPELSESSTYWWKVMIWDQNDEAGEWSEPQRFNTGEYEPADLRWPGESRWIELRSNEETGLVLENRHVMRYHEIKPVSVVKNDKGNHFISFEKAAFGVLELTLNNPERHDTLIIHLGEKLAPGNQVDRDPGGSITYDLVNLAIEPGRTKYLVELPRFISNYPNSQVLAEHMPEVTAFRYAEIEGIDGDLDISRVQQLALIYHFDDSASGFHSSDDNLNQIWDLCKHTLKVTPFMGVYIDGGARERMPYEADAYVQQISHYAVDREYAIQRYTTNFLIYNPSWPTEWHLHIVLMAWADYMATGDSRFLEEYYGELKKKTLLPLAREDGLISTRTGLATPEFLATIHYHGRQFRDIVDWPQGTPANETRLRSGHGSVTFEGETDRYIFSDINTVVNAFHYKNLVLMARIAGVLGKTDDRQFFEERSALVRSSINEKLLDREKGVYRDGEGVDHYAFHASMFPVAFGLAPEDYYPQLGKFLKSKGMACSPYGTPYLFDALYRLGLEDYALELLTSESDRSWMNMIRFGTTITSEAWDIKYKRNMTWNHAWGAAPVYIVTHGIFGIEPLEPAYRSVLIRPQPGDLRSAELKSPTIRGPINVRFTREPEVSFNLEVVIPPNTEAKVMLPRPAVDRLSLFVNGRGTPVVIEEGYVLVDNLKAGRYTLELR